MVKRVQRQVNMVHVVTVEPSVNRRSNFILE